MNKSRLSTCVSLSTLAVATSFATLAFAQDSAPAPVEGGYLDEIVVTATLGERSKIDTAISATSVDPEIIRDFQPSSESELLRLIPGIQVAGTAGPGGNSNIAVRGLPVATGGSPFVQLQEDGLPTVLFGDIQFGNNDYWTRFDASVANVEGIRGGTASTLASQAPGAIINYISHTGEEEGGFVQIGKGLNFKETKIDFRYGGPISDTLRFHIGGFFKTGQGPLNADYQVSDSVQLKGNITKDFDEGKGFIRFLAKFADTQEPNYTGAPAIATISGGEVSDIEPFPGFDGRDQSNYSINNQNQVIFNRQGDLERTPIDGITTKQTTFGSQFHYELSDNFRVDNNFRWSDISGGFAAPFLNVVPVGSVIGSNLQLNGVTYATVDEIRYANGPLAGQVFTGDYVDNNVNVRTNIRDLGSLANDLAVTGKFDSDLGAVTVRAGYFYFSQDIEMDWHVNRSTREVSGDNPAQLDLFDAAGAQLTFEGISGYNNNWGSCCARDYELNYTDQAPYIALDLDTDHFALDGSVRFDRVDASGFAIGGGSEFFVTAANGVDIPTITADGVSEVLNYSRSYTSWTGGALWKASDNLSFFGRASRGARFNGDRQTLSGKITADGRLNDVGEVAAIDFVKQYELGVKGGADLGFGSVTAELTLLKGNFKQSTFELSATRCPGMTPGGCVIDARFKSKGAEFYGTFNSGGFSLYATATYSDAERSGVDAMGNPTPFVRSPGIPDLLYTVAANYDVNDLVSIGVSTTGQTSSVDDAQRVYPGTAIFNSVLSVRPIQNLEASLNVYNLFNTFDLRGNGGVAAPLVGGGVDQFVIGGAPAIGRTLTASLRYSF